jgi:hypothetical protein
MKKQTASQDERWCLIRIATPEVVLTDRQCEHAQAPGHYVVQSGSTWHIFDPPTKLQAIIWAKQDPMRDARIRWKCGECGAIMPLTDQLPKQHRRH